LALEFRGKKFLSVPEAAEQLGVTRLTVFRWLHGTRNAPDGFELRDVIRDTRTRQAYLSESIVKRLRQALRRTQRADARRPRR
jgi:transposase